MGPEDIMRMLMSGGQPDPAEMRRQRSAALKATTLDDESVERLMGIADGGRDWTEWAESIIGSEAANREVTFTMPLEVFVALSNACGSGAVNAINGLMEAGQFIQGSGSPADAVMDTEEMKNKIRLLLAMWDAISALRAEQTALDSPVPDDASSLTG